jgi:hypothetical protein
MDRMKRQGRHVLLTEKSFFLRCGHQTAIIDYRGSRIAHVR